MIEYSEGLKRLARDFQEMHDGVWIRQFSDWAYAAGHGHMTVEDFLLDLARKLEDDER